MASKKENTNKGKEVQTATAGCTDKNCSIHGTTKTRGRSFVGAVESDKMAKTVVVAWTRKFFVKKFERYEVRTSKMNAHNPDCINAKKGDLVEIVETRPLSKTKHFTVTKILGKASAKDVIKVETIEHEDSREALARKREDKEKDEE